MNCLATVANNIGVVVYSNSLSDCTQIKVQGDRVGIIDVHTHHNLRQIVENKSFPNIWRVEVLEERKEYANSV